MFDQTNAKDRLTRLRHGTPVVSYQTAQTQWQLFIPKTLENRQAVEVISTRERLWVARYGAVFLVAELHLDKNRQLLSKSNGDYIGNLTN